MQILSVIVDQRLLDAIRTLVADLAAGRLREVEADGRAGRLSADEIEHAIRLYGRTLQPLPDDAEQLIQVMPLDSDPRRLSVDVDLWTREEGRSDLTLQVEAWLDGNDYRLKIMDLHVL